jgi:hypothetical protein
MRGHKRPLIGNGVRKIAISSGQSKIVARGLQQGAHPHQPQVMLGSNAVQHVQPISLPATSRSIYKNIEFSCFLGVALSHNFQRSLPTACPFWGYNWGYMPNELPDITPCH